MRKAKEGDCRLPLLTLKASTEGTKLPLLLTLAPPLPPPITPAEEARSTGTP